MVFSAVRCAWPPLELHSASDDRLISALVEYLQVIPLFKIPLIQYRLISEITTGANSRTTKSP